MQGNCNAFLFTAFVEKNTIPVHVSVFHKSTTVGCHQYDSYLLDIKEGLLETNCTCIRKLGTFIN